MRYARIRSGIVVVASTLMASRAMAQDSSHFGSKGQLLISADRLIPFFAYSSGKVGATTVRETSFSLLANTNTTVGSNVPRIAADFVVADNITVGGSAFVFFTAGSSQTTTTGATWVVVDVPSRTAFGAQARAGYMYKVADYIGLWPRLGLGVASGSSNGRTETVLGSSVSTHQFSLSLEPLVTVNPVPNFFFQAGPVLDVPLSGSTKTEVSAGPTTTATTVDSSVFHLGITAGFGGYFSLF